MAAKLWITTTLALLCTTHLTSGAPKNLDLTDLTSSNCRTEPRDSPCVASCGLSRCYDVSTFAGNNHPQAGMCSAYNNTHVTSPGLSSYTVSATICLVAVDHPQGTGLLFNWQDQLNYDMIYKFEQTDSTCIVGYVENDAITDVSTFPCPPTVAENTHQFSVTAYASGQANATLMLQDGTVAASALFTTHFPLASRGGALMVTDGASQYLEFTDVLLEETATGPCSSSPCINGGTCVEDGSGYTCQCPPAVTGTNCQSDVVSPCSSSPCINGGTCVEAGDGYTCQCPPTFTGTNCQSAVAGGGCESSPCVNGGNCVEDDGAAGYICQCPSKVYGPQCASPVTSLEYQVRLGATFMSADGETIPPSCGPEYSDAMDEKMLEMVGVINAAIGTIICIGKTADDVLVASAASFLAVSGTSGQTSVRFIMSIGDDQPFFEVINCGDEISSFLQPFPTWGEPILPSIPDCPDLDFDGDRWNATGNEWICIDNFLHHRHLPSDNMVSMEIGIEGAWETVNGEVLSIDCAIKYDEELTEQAFDALADTNALLGTQLCVQSAGMRLTTASKLFSPVDNTGLATVNYFTSIDTTMLISDAYICAREISDYIRKYSTWGNPVLPTQPGCPGLTFRGSEFMEMVQRWACTAQNP